MAEGTQPKKRQFRRYTYRGIDLDDLVKRTRGVFTPPGILPKKEAPVAGGAPQVHPVLQEVRGCKEAAPFGEKPKLIKTHLRNAIILPEIVGANVGIYNGKTFVPVEIKADMIGGRV